MSRYERVPCPGPGYHGPGLRPRYREQINHHITPNQAVFEHVTDCTDPDTFDRDRISDIVSGNGCLFVLPAPDVANPYALYKGRQVACFRTYNIAGVTYNPRRKEMLLWNKITCQALQQAEQGVRMLIYDAAVHTQAHVDGHCLPCVIPLARHVKLVEVLDAVDIFIVITSSSAQGCPTRCVVYSLDTYAQLCEYTLNCTHMAVEVTAGHILMTLDNNCVKMIDAVTGAHIHVRWGEVWIYVPTKPPECTHSTRTCNLCLTLAGVPLRLCTHCLMHCC